MSGKPVQSHRDLEVYQLAFQASMRIFELSRKFPQEERYALTDQMRRSSRSICANLAEAWRKRRYEGSFLAKLSDAEAEAAETQTWLEFAVRCGYLDAEQARELYRNYDRILGKLVTMIRKPAPWLIETDTQWGQPGAVKDAGADYFYTHSRMRTASPDGAGEDAGAPRNLDLASDSV